MDIHISIEGPGAPQLLEFKGADVSTQDDVNPTGAELSLNGSETVLIRVDGELDTNTSPQLESALATLLGSGGRRLLLELTEMDYVSSVGLRVLLATLKKLKADQGRLLLIGLNPEVREIFDMAGFSSLFEITSSLEEARALLAG